MSFERFISFRYLFSREHKTLVNLITIISILGVALGVTALIVVISVMDGFDQELISKMMGTFAHIDIRGDPYEGISNYRQLESNLRQVKEVVGVAPVITRQALLQRSTGIRTPKVGVQMWGIDPEKEQEVTDITGNVVQGKAIPGHREVILGIQLAQRLGVSVDSSIYAITRLARTAHGPYAKIARLSVAGIFESGLYDVDANFAYTSLETMREIFLLDDIADGIHLKLKDPYKARQVKDKISAMLSPMLMVLSWEELNPDFFKALRLEKLTMFIILLLIIVVAAFNIIGTLIMIVSQKTREIGMIKSMGATNGGVLRIFLFYGVAIGLIGVTAGLGLGLLLCFILKNYIHYDLPDAIYGIDTLPVRVEPLTVLIIVVATMVICMAASIVPAWQASKLDPAEALRYE